MTDLDAAFFEVDAHNVVPCRLASDKQEYSARTIRPKIIRLLPAFLKEPPKVISHPIRFPGSMPQTDWTELEKSLQVDRSVVPVSWIKSGEQAARSALDNFLRNRLSRYTEDKNDPNKEAVSDLSPYLHFTWTSEGEERVHMAGLEL